MLWPTLTTLSLALLATVLVLGWRRLDRLQRQLARSQAEAASLLSRHQQARADVEARQLTLLNSMVEGVLLLDARRRIQVANEALLRLFGLKAGVQGQTLTEAFRMEALDQVADRVIQEGQVLNYEVDVPGMERRTLQLNAACLPRVNGEHQGLLLVFHDLTRIKQLENTRKEFVANVSHELRTPLSLIKGFTETLLNGAMSDPAVAERFLQTIEKHADRLTYLIEDLLTLSRLESGQIVMNLQPASLHQVAEEVLADLQSRAHSRDVTLLNQVPADLQVIADADRLQQVFFNLIDNAIKYGRSGGRVEITAAPRTSTFAEIQVHDDGPGIPPDALLRVFERFYRVDKARSREQGGTGLGLAIVKHIVQAHGGEAWARSEPGQGTTFGFTLPLG